MVVAIENWRHRRSWAPLRQGEVHLWRARLESHPSLACHLSVEEWMRAGQFVSDLDRRPVYLNFTFVVKVHAKFSR